MARTSDTRHPDAHHDARDAQQQQDLESRVDKLEVDVHQLQADFKSLGNRVYALETGTTVPYMPVPPLTPSDGNLEVRVRKLEEDVHQLQTNYKDLGNRVYKLETGQSVQPPQVTPAPPPTGTLDQRIAKLESDVAQLRLNADNLDERVTALENAEPEQPPNDNRTLQQLVDQGGAVTLPKDNYKEFCTVNKDVQITGIPTTIDVTGMTITNQKGIFDAQKNLELTGVTLVGARVPDSNGAGIRGAVGANITMTNCEAYNCQMGILCSGGGADVIIAGCYFHDCGAGDGRSHEIYVSGYSQAGQTGFTMTNSRSIGGNNSCIALKVRANRITVKDCELRGSMSSNGNVAGRVVDFPEGGEVLMENCEIELRATSPTSSIFAYAAENTNHGIGTVTLRNVKIIDSRNRGGDIYSRSGVGSKLVLENCTYTAANPPTLTGWGSVTGQFTKA